MIAMTRLLRSEAPRKVDQCSTIRIHAPAASPTGLGERTMTKISNSTFVDETVHLDGVVYERCTFTRCMVVYSATTPIGLIANRFDACVFSFAGAAAETLAFMKALYAMDPKTIDETFRPV